MANKYTPTYETVLNIRILSNEKKNALLEALMDIATPEWKTKDGGSKDVAFDILQTAFVEKIPGCDLLAYVIAMEVCRWHRELKMGVLKMLLSTFWRLYLLRKSLDVIFQLMSLRWRFVDSIENIDSLKSC